MIARWKLAVAVALIAGPLYAQERVAPVAPRGELKSVREKASYSFGMMIGTNLKKQSVDVDINLFVQGLRDASAGGKLLLTEQQAGEAIQAFEKEVAARKSQESKDFLVQNKKRQGVKTTESGLQYKVVKAGKGPRPKKTDAVNVVYRGMFINGDEFDSSGGKPFTIGVDQVIDGWKEALQLMEVGSKWMLYIPAELAYGAQGQPPSIAPNTTLVFELELVEITKAPPAGPASKARPSFE
jgi:FKBP-type peptidyl-prolyl cis-trans isomerase